MVKELFVLISSLLAIRHTGKVEGADWHGKVTTSVMYVTMIVHLVFPGIPDAVSIALTALSTGLILLSGTLYGIRNIRSIRAGE